MLVLQDIEDSLEEATLIKITMDDIKSFQDNVGKPFVSTLKANISSRFCSQDVVSAFSIFDPRKLQVLILLTTNIMVKIPWVCCLTSMELTKQHLL